MDVSKFFARARNLRFDIIRILFGLWRNLDRISFADDAYITFEVTFWSAYKVLGVR